MLRLTCGPSVVLAAPIHCSQPSSGDVVGDRQRRGGVAVGIDEVAPRARARPPSPACSVGLVGSGADVDRRIDGSSAELVSSSSLHATAPSRSAAAHRSEVGKSLHGRCPPRLVLAPQTPAALRSVARNFSAVESPRNGRPRRLERRGSTPRARGWQDPWWDGRRLHGLLPGRVPGGGAAGVAADARPRRRGGRRAGRLRARAPSPRDGRTSHARTCGPPS